MSAIGEVMGGTWVRHYESCGALHGSACNERCSSTVDAARKEIAERYEEVRRLRAKVVLADKLAEAAHDLTRWDICRFVEQAPEDERIYFESGVGSVRSAVVRYRKGVT